MQVYFPHRQGKITATLALELTANEGFAANSRRGTGHYFDQSALDRFLIVNQLSLVVRAHEVHQSGFMVSRGNVYVYNGNIMTTH